MLINIVAVLLVILVFNIRNFQIFLKEKPNFFKELINFLKNCFKQ